jgi:hypothetical protein
LAKLKDKNPYSPLVIDPKYLQDDLDVQAVVEGVILLNRNCEAYICRFEKLYLALDDRRKNNYTKLCETVD